MSCKLSCRRVSACLLAAASVLLPSCQPGGNFTILGYTTQPNYNLEIHTVRVPIFKNETFYRGLEFQLTEAVIREIELKTPFKVVTAGCPADTELTGKITGFSKNIVNFTQLNNVREAETTLTVEVTWKDLRPGHIGEFLSAPVPKPPSTEAINPPSPPANPPPVLVQSVASYQPELGPSFATAQKQNVDRVAVQIVSMMEKPW
jgi:hypothetical protein